MRPAILVTIVGLLAGIAWPMAARPAPAPTRIAGVEVTPADCLDTFPNRALQDERGGGVGVVEAMRVYPAEEGIDWSRGYRLDALRVFPLGPLGFLIANDADPPVSPQARAMDVPMRYWRAFGEFARYCSQYERAGIPAEPYLRAASLAPDRVEAVRAWAAEHPRTARGKTAGPAPEDEPAAPGQELDAPFLMAWSLGLRPFSGDDLLDDLAVRVAWWATIMDPRHGRCRLSSRLGRGTGMVLHLVSDGSGHQARVVGAAPLVSLSIRVDGTTLFDDMSAGGDAAVRLNDAETGRLLEALSRADELTVIPRSGGPEVGAGPVRIDLTGYSRGYANYRRCLAELGKGHRSQPGEGISR